MITMRRGSGPRLLARLEAGRGASPWSAMPARPWFPIPGFKLVRAAIAEGMPCMPCPGASAVLTGLALSRPAVRPLFVRGLSAAKAGERRAALEELKSVRATLIFFESAQRLGESLDGDGGGPGPAHCRGGAGMTKLHEEVRRGSLARIGGALCATPRAPKGEVTLLVGTAAGSRDRYRQDRCGAGRRRWPSCR